MTKKQITIEVKKAWNNEHFIDGIKIIHVGWREHGRMVVEHEDTFADAIKKDFVPIQSFRTQKELVDSLYMVINK